MDGNVTLLSSIVFLVIMLITATMVYTLWSKISERCHRQQADYEAAKKKRYMLLHIDKKLPTPVGARVNVGYESTNS